MCNESALRGVWNSIAVLPVAIVMFTVAPSLAVMSDVPIPIDLKQQVERSAGNAPEILENEPETGFTTINNINIFGIKLTGLCDGDTCYFFPAGADISARRRRLSKSSKGQFCPDPFFCFCFSGYSTVDVEGKGITLMKDLQVGDKVLAANGEYQTVYSFMHHHKFKPSSYLQIYTDSPLEGPLEISSEHMVFLDGKKNPVPASQIKVGDKLAAQYDTATVSKIKNVMRDGLYAPVTADGTLVVNGILASSFITFQDSDTLEIGGYKVISYQLLEHMWEMPHRVLCLGLKNFCKNEAHNEDGYNKWSYLGIRILRGAEQQNTFIQVIMFLIGMSILFPLYAAEMIATTPGAFAAVLTTVGAWHYVKKNFGTTVDTGKTVE